MQETILLVEDDELFMDFLHETLARAGFTVIHTRNYEDALTALEHPTQRIDLLLTDIVMPKGVNGFALARMARVRRPGLKVLYLTGADVPTEEASGKVLLKPISRERLVSEVQAALRT